MESVVNGSFPFLRGYTNVDITRDFCDKVLAIHRRDPLDFIFSRIPQRFDAEFQILSVKCSYSVQCNTSNIKMKH